MIDIEKKLKELENEERKLADKKQKLIEEQKLIEARQAKLQDLYNNSGYNSPRELVEDLIQKFGLRLGSSSASDSQPRRTRTRITAQLRDAVKADIEAGNTKVSVSKKHGISYVVVGKIAKGEYDKL
ncbi:MAG: hypothetical protein ABQ298_02750 [Puniceicoccaceae bacterium]